MDGADNVDRGSNLTLMVFPSIDSIEEFKVQRSLYTADSGRAGGAQVTVVTRSGTNVFHGSAYEYLKRPSLNATSFSNNSKGWARTIRRWINRKRACSAASAAPPTLLDLERIEAPPRNTVPGGGRSNQ